MEGSSESDADCYRSEKSSSSRIDSLFDSGYNSNAISLTSLQNSSILNSDCDDKKSEYSSKPSDDQKSNNLSFADSGLCVGKESKLEEYNDYQSTKFSNIILNPNLYKFAFFQDEDGDTILHLAIAAKDKHVAFDLIKSASDSRKLDISNNLFQTPLHLAALTDQVEVFEKLVTAGADFSVRNVEGNTPLHIISNDWDLNKYSFLFDTFNVCMDKKLKSVLKMKNYHGLACLHLAATKCNRSNIQFLISVGIDIDEREDKSGKTILHLSVESKKVEFIHFLLKQCSASVNYLNYAGRTPLDIACNMSTISGESYHNRILIHLLKEFGGKTNHDYTDDDDTDADFDDD